MNYLNITERLIHLLPPPPIVTGKHMAELNRALLDNDIQYLGMRSVTITERRVYHKVAKITIELPKDLPLEDTERWLQENTSKWEQTLDNEFKTA